MNRPHLALLAVLAMRAKMHHFVEDGLQQLNIST